MDAQGSTQGLHCRERRFGRCGIDTVLPDMGMDGFLVTDRSKGSASISGRKANNNGHCRILQSKNSDSAESFLQWIYADKGNAFMQRKLGRFKAFLSEKAQYIAVTCAVCGTEFERRSSTDKHCAPCARIRQRLCNRRADYRRRHGASASMMLNDYRLPSEQHLNFL